MLSQKHCKIARLSRKFLLVICKMQPIWRNNKRKILSPVQRKVNHAVQVVYFFNKRVSDVFFNLIDNCINFKRCQRPVLLHLPVPFSFSLFSLIASVPQLSCAPIISPTLPSSILSSAAAALLHLLCSFGLLYLLLQFLPSISVL